MIKNILNIDTFRGISSTPQLSSSLTEFSARLHTMLNQIISELSTIQTGNAIYGSTLRTVSSDVIIPPVNPYLYPATRVRDGYLAAADFVIFDDKYNIPTLSSGKFLTNNGVTTSWADLPLTGQDHSGLTNLAYADSGHTGFEPALGFTPLNSAHSTTPGAWDHSLFAVGTDVHSIPSGGDAFQILAKIDGTDYNVGWVDAMGALAPLTTKGDLFTYSTVVDRLGVGTNGQVLTAASGEVTGLIWATPSVYTSPVTTKGDIFTFSTVEDRLGVGTNGYVLVADSTTTTGLKWIAGGSISGAGTVTSVSVTTSAGVSGSVATPTTTPAITVVLGRISPIAINITTLESYDTNSTTSLYHRNDIKSLWVGSGAKPAGITTGVENIGIGTQSLLGITNGSSNVALGYRALWVGDGFYNTAIGISSLQRLTTGDSNTCVGMQTAWNLTTGSYNTCVGMSSGLSLTTGAGNICLGYTSGTSLTTGTDNTILGTGIGGNITSGARNVLIGTYVGANFWTTVSDNILIGREICNTLGGAHNTGSYNIFLGTALGAVLSTGVVNIGIGVSSGNSLSSGGYNIFLGNQALFSGTTCSSNIALGKDSLFTCITGSNNLCLGNYSGRYATSSNEFYVDAFDRTNTAGDKAGALFYGGFNTTPSSQFLYINAGDIRLGTTGTNYTKFEADGTMVMVGNATTWNDSMIPATAFRTGGTGLTLAAFSGNIWMHRFDVGDIFYVQIQLPHDMKENSVIYPHLHLSVNSAIGATGYNVEVTTEHAFSNMGSAFGTPVVTSTGLVHSFQNAAQYKHDIMNLAAITPGTGEGGISSYVIFKIERITSSVEPLSPATALFILGMDIHYEMDTIGSRGITSK